MVCAHLLVCNAAVGHICWIFDWNRVGKRTTCGAAQFSVCTLSLCRAAGCAYLLHLLLWSAEHKELKDGLKGSESLFSSPCCPHLFITSCSSSALILPSAHVDLYFELICWCWNLLLSELVDRPTVAAITTESNHFTGLMYSATNVSKGTMLVVSNWKTQRTFYKKFVSYQSLK